VTYKDYYTKLGNGNFAAGEEELQMHTGESKALTDQKAIS